jgi:hypothetical protein
MILSWFDASKEKKFGMTLARFFIERMPLDKTKGKEKSPTKIPEVLDKMFLQIARYKSEHKLNVYKRAQFANTFKWSLKDAGYDHEFVDRLTQELVLRF